MDIHEIYRTDKDIHDKAGMLGSYPGEHFHHLFTVDGLETAKTMVGNIIQDSILIDTGVLDWGYCKPFYYTYNYKGVVMHYIINKPMIFTMAMVTQERE